MFVQISSLTSWTRILRDAAGLPRPSFTMRSVDGSAVNVSILFDQTLIKTLKRTESVLQMSMSMSITNF